MNVRSVGIVGYGAFGAFAHILLTRFAPHLAVRAYDPGHAPDESLFATLEETCAADVIILAVPIRSFEEVLAAALPHISDTSLIVDVATVKMHTVHALETLATRRRYIATHPMFGPETYQKREGDINGLRVVIAGHSVPANDYAACLLALRSIGLTVIETTAEAHDRQLAETLFLTHFIGQAVSRAGFVRTEIDTASFGSLMDAVDIVKNDTALFKDVVRYDPFCKEVLERFEQAVEETKADTGA